MLQIALLGRYDIHLNDEPLTLTLRPVQNLLAYLLLNRDKRHRREQLAGILWPDYTEASARKNLRNTVYRLRQAIGERYLAADRSSIAFNTDVSFWLDVAQLEESASADEIEERIQAVSLFQGDLLPGFYEDWVLRERERLQAVFERRMQTLLESLNEAGRWSESLTWAEHWIAHGQVPEPAYRVLMATHAAQGDQASMVQAYRRGVKALKEKVGIEPSSETIALYQNLLSGEQIHGVRKKDIKTSPTLRLPLQPTPFIGRKNELKELGALLADPAIRLVNIMGPGGIGKTRLAIEAARAQSVAYADGVYFVSLAALDDPNLIATTIANAINFSFHVQVHLEKDHQNEQLLAYLRDKKMTLVLDNLEHLLDGLPLIANILQVAHGVKILTTSRERLGLRGETVYIMGSMHVPEKITEEALLIVETHDALQLFVQCAERAQPNFELSSNNLNDVVTVCQLVDGLPLGIELAAAWAGLLAPGEIATEIKINLDFLSSNYHDIPDRQQSIRSVFESSWNRLAEIERDVFQQLSVFRGGFTRPAAESVTGATVQILMALVNKSLVKSDYTGRYHIHELLSQYGSEKLREADELERTRDRHLEFFLKVAEESEPKLAGSDQITWANRLELEHDNLRVALKWSRTTEGTAESGLRLTGSLAYFWQWRGYFSEGREHLSAALSNTEASERTEARAKALYEAGLLAYVQGDFPAAGALIEESLSIYRELGPASRLSLAHALLMLGDTETGVGNYTAAVSVIEEGLGIMRELNNSSGSARALWKLGWCMVSQGDYEQASQCFAEDLPFYRRIGDKDGLSMVLSGLGEVAVRQGDYGGATELLEESLALRREVGDRWGIAASFGTLAWVALRQGDLKRATTLLVESLQLRRELGDRGGTAWCLEKMAEIALTTGQREFTPQRDEDFRRAARLFGAADALRAPVNSAIDLVDQPEYERQIAVLQAQLDEASFTTAWAEGQAMTLQQAIDCALAVEPGQLGLAK